MIKAKRDVIDVLVVTAVILMMVTEEATGQVTEIDCNPPGGYCFPGGPYHYACCDTDHYECRSDRCVECPSPYNGITCGKLGHSCCNIYTCDAWFYGGTCHEYPGPGESCSIFSPCRKGYSCSAWFWDGKCNAITSA